jgi:Xaa-Pro aminopeptidase
MTRFAAALLLALLCSTSAYAERMGYPPTEFAARRDKLAAAVQKGLIVMFGATEVTPGLRFRQDNDFFYLTGNESLNGVLVIDAATKASHLFLPKLTAVQIRYEGGNWLDEADAAKAHAFTSIQPLSVLGEFLGRRRGVSGTERFWTRLSERDEVNSGRVDAAIEAGRRSVNPFATRPSEDAVRIAQLRLQFPYYVFHDVTPLIDTLRVIKTPREIEILRYSGRVSAEAMKRAIQATAAGKHEYELEAEATYWHVKHGMQAAAYPAIVGSGPMGNQWHYEDSGRQMKAGELVVMDYAGSLDQLTTDITRTWPVSGRFSDVQRKAYDCVLETQKAIIAAIKPGVARDVIAKLAQDIYKRHGFDPVNAYVGHYVGLSVHDVGDWNAPFEAGMVLAIEPIVDLPDQQLHIRIEDTILVTPTGAEVLTPGLPKEVDELLALITR